MRCMLAWAVALGSMAAVMGQDQEIDQKLVEQVRQDGAKGWTRCRSIFDDLSCRVSITEKASDGTVSSENLYRIESALNRSEYMVVELDNKGRIEHARSATNARYTFKVGQNENGNGWYLADGGPVTSELSLSKISKAMGTDANILMKSATIYRLPLDELFSDKDHFQLIACRRMDNAIVQCIFKCRHPIPALADRTLEIEFDPNNDWGVKRFLNTPNSDPNTFQLMEFEYQRAPNGASCIKSASQKRASSKSSDSATFQVFDFGECKIPSKEFYLPFYGISESSLLPRTQTDGFWWYAMIGGGVMLIFLGLFLKKKRST